MEINGIPLHPLVVHAAVVLGPLAALGALAFVGVPRWRGWLRTPLAVLVLLGTLAIVGAYLSGDNFLESRPELGQIPNVELHEERAELLLWTTVAFGVVGLATLLGHGKVSSSALTMVLRLLFAALAVAVLVLAFLTGDAGARAVWG